MNTQPEMLLIKDLAFLRGGDFPKDAGNFSVVARKRGHYSLIGKHAMILWYPPGTPSLDERRRKAVVKEIGRTKPAAPFHEPILRRAGYFFSSFSHH